MSAAVQQHHRSAGGRAGDRRRVRLARAWITAGVLLVVAGAVGGLATFLHWSGCTVDVSTATCIDLENRTGSLPQFAAGEPAPVLLLGGLCVLAVAAAWVTAVVAARLRPTLTVAAGLTVVQPALAVVSVLARDRVPGLADAVLGSLWCYLISGLAALVFAGLVLMEDELSGADRLRWLALTVAVTVFGPVAGLIENLVLAYLHPELADAVPGTGYGLAGVLGVVGVGLLTASAVEAVRRRRSPLRTTHVTTSAHRSLVRV